MWWISCWLEKTFSKICVYTIQINCKHCKIVILVKAIAILVWDIEFEGKRSDNMTNRLKLRFNSAWSENVWGEARLFVWQCFLISFYGIEINNIASAWLSKEIQKSNLELPLKLKLKILDSSGDRLTLILLNGMPLWQIFTMLVFIIIRKHGKFKVPLMKMHC